MNNLLKFEDSTVPWSVDLFVLWRRVNIGLVPVMGLLTDFKNMVTWLWLQCFDILNTIFCRLFKVGHLFYNIPHISESHLSAKSYCSGSCFIIFFLSPGGGGGNLLFKFCAAFLKALHLVYNCTTYCTCTVCVFWFYKQIISFVCQLCDAIL